MWKCVGGKRPSSQPGSFQQGIFSIMEHPGANFRDGNFTGIWLLHCFFTFFSPTSTFPLLCFFCHHLGPILVYGLPSRGKLSVNFAKFLCFGYQWLFMCALHNFHAVSCESILFFVYVANYSDILALSNEIYIRNKLFLIIMFVI